jgi:type II secretory pathway pseudopilin PulG
MTNFQLSNYKLRNRGYSLIEVLIYLGLFVVLSSATAALFTQVVQLQAVSRARGQLSWQAEKVFLDMSQEIHDAESIDSPLSGESLDVLILNGGLVQYQLNNGVLEKVEGGEVMGLTSDPIIVDSLAFNNYSSEDNLGVQIQLTLKLPGQIPSMLEIVEDYQTSVFVRK